MVYLYRLSYTVLFWAMLMMANAPVSAEEAGGDLVPLVVNLLNDKDKDVRSLGLEQVRTEAKGAAATKEFAAQLPKLPADGQVGLLSALADRGDAAARPAVLELLEKSRDAAVRVAAISALGVLGQQEDLALLMPLLVCDSQAEKAAARKSLGQLRGDAVAKAMAAELKQQGTAPLRVALIEVLAIRRARDVLAEILPCAADADPAVRAAAMNALGQLAAAEHLAGMIQGVLTAKSGSERDAAEKAVALVCGRIPDESKREETLLALIDQVPTSDRSHLLPMLGRVGGTAALARIEPAVADSDPQMHAIGMRAICNWPDASIAARLVELAQTDPHAEHKSLAVGAIIRIAPLPDKRTAAERLSLLTKAMSLCSKDSQRNQVLKRASAIRIVESLRFLAPYLEQPAYAQQACESVVELAHHRDLREPNKAEFHKMLDKVIQTSQDATVKDRANRYKNNQTWVRPKAEN